jgi:hypothetical protein
MQKLRYLIRTMYRAELDFTVDRAVPVTTRTGFPMTAPAADWPPLLGDSLTITAQYWPSRSKPRAGIKEKRQHHRGIPAFEPG